MEFAKQGNFRLNPARRFGRRRADDEQCVRLGQRQTHLLIEAGRCGQFRPVAEDGRKASRHWPPIGRHANEASRQPIGFQPAMQLVGLPLIGMTIAQERAITPRACSVGIDAATRHAYSAPTVFIPRRRRAIGSGVVDAHMLIAIARSPALALPHLPGNLQSSTTAAGRGRPG